MNKFFNGPRWRRAPCPIAWTIVPIACAAIVATCAPHPLVLWNPTPSEPMGLYIRRATPPGVGVIIAFRTPGAAFPYADQRMAYLHRIPILKTVAAVQGDMVCTDGGVLTINGRRRAAVNARDSRGAELPAWRGCRALAPGEFFVFSDRAPNSFDSRYYGPIDQHSIVGVFSPLLIDSGAERDA